MSGFLPALVVVFYCSSLLIDSATSQTLSVEEKQKILDRHNHYRSQVAIGNVFGQPAGSNLLLLDWDDDAVTRVQNWTNYCSWGHDEFTARLYSNYSYVGQNMACGSNYGTPTTVTRGVDAWYNEVLDFNFDVVGSTQRGVVGHYTQLVWANSAVIGCSRTDCSKTNTCSFFVGCNYAPGGNWGGEYPYKTGKACTACPVNYPKCYKGLCATNEQCVKSNLQCQASTTESGVWLSRGENYKNADILARVPDIPSSMQSSVQPAANSQYTSVSSRSTTPSPFIGTAQGDAVLYLSDNNFTTTIQQTRYMVVVFYVPFSSRWATFKPVFEQVAAALKARVPPVVSAKVNMAKNRIYYSFYGMRSLIPFTIAVFVNGALINSSVDAIVPQDTLSFQSFIEGILPKTDISQYTSTPSPTVGASVLVLSDSNFTTTIHQTQYMVVAFYLPRCSRWTTFKPVFEKVAAALKARVPPVIAGKVNMSGNEIYWSFSERRRMSSPTITVIVNGALKNLSDTFPRDAIGFKSFVETILPV